jgi:signal transduction histidine kinase
MAEYILSPSRMGDREGLQKLLWARLGHDLKNDFGMLEATASLSPGMDLDAARARLASVHVRAGHIQRVVSGIRELATGRKGLDEFSSLGLLGKLQEYAQDKWSGTSFSVEGEDRVVRSREAPLYIQLFNFVLNGVRAGQRNPQPRHVRLSTGDAPLAAAQQGYLGAHSLRYEAGTPFVRFSVQDYGTGIPAERLPAIFEPYATFEGSSGTGLALAGMTCDALHGFLEVESEVGKGSTFSIHIPRYRKE